MNNLKRIRENIGITQLELAKKIHVTKAAISNYETGFRHPNIKIAQKIIIELNSYGYNFSTDDVFPPKEYSKAS